MSQRATASRPASRSPPDGQRITLPPVQLRDDPPQGGRHVERLDSKIEAQILPRQLHPSPPNARTLQKIPSVEEWRSSGLPRDLGVHSILNPSEPDGGGSLDRRMSGATAESPSSVVGPPMRFGTSPSITPQHAFPGHQPATSTSPTVENYGANFSRGPRRILTPRSPSRAISGGRLSQGTIDAQRSPFLPSRGRAYMAEPGHSTSSEVPPMPTPPGHQQQQYGFPPSGTAPSIAPRRTSGAMMQAPSRTPLSQSASPSISASSHNPASSQTSPASFLYGGKDRQGPQTTTPYFSGASFATSIQQQQQAQGGGIQFQGPSEVHPGPYSAPPESQGSSLHSSSASSSRQTSASDPIKVLTIATSEGPFYVPVDVHQASRLADEKRARNAGASARFRQRRKEKEREASTNIEKLQQQTRDLERKVRETEQEKEWYRGERDRLRDVLYRNPDTRHLAMQAPASPRSMRSGSGSFSGSISGSMSGSISQMGGPPPPPPPPMRYESEGPQDRAPRRRRTDTQGEFTSLPFTLPPATSLPPVQSSGYPPVMPTHTQAPPNLPPMRVDNPNIPQTKGPNPPVTTAPGPQPSFDPYSRGSFDRGWPSEGGRR